MTKKTGKPAKETAAHVLEIVAEPGEAERPKAPRLHVYRPIPWCAMRT